MKRFSICAALVAVLALAVAPSAFADQDFTCSNGRSVGLDGSNSLWPPNHKYHDYTAWGQGTAMDMNARVMTAITSDEPDVGLGSGGPKHAEDAKPAMATGTGSGNYAETFHQLRSERAGPGDGRVYTVNVMASWNMGLITCSHSFQVTVPHDMGNN